MTRKLQDAATALLDVATLATTHVMRVLDPAANRVYKTTLADVVTFLNGVYAAISHAHAAGDVTSGTFADARVSQSSVTQHNAALDHGALSGNGDDDHTQYSLVAGTRAFSGAVAGVAPTSGAHLATKSYVDSLVQGVEWHKSVADRDLDTPPGAPSTGDRYIVATGGTGAWSGHDMEIAEWDGAAWVFTAPTLGSTVALDDELRSVRWDGDSWEFLESFLSHQALVGAGTLTHSQLDAQSPSTDEKAALAGTNGAASAANKYVTNSDPRNSDARAPTSHALSAHTAAVADLDVGSQALLAVKRARTKVTASTSTAGAVTFDIGAGGNFRMPLTEDLTAITISNASGDEQKGCITFVQDSTPRGVTGWPGTAKWLTAGAGAPAMPAGSGAVMLVAYYWNGTELLLSTGADA